MIIVAGEPGGSIPATRARIEQQWAARVIDHHGATEVGPLSFECVEAPGFLHLNEGEYICEVLERGSERAVADGESGELVVTNLGRAASPVIRYRTGDIVVRQSAPCPCGRTWARLEGGVLARADDMINIRGVNVYPAGIESVVRYFVPEVAEFRSTVSQSGSLRSLSIEVEPVPSVGGPPAGPDLVAKVAQQLRVALGFTVPICLVATGPLAPVRDEGPAIHRGGRARADRSARDPRRQASPDVVVIGGGPAGSTVSTLIAQQGCRVELFERERFRASISANR